MTLLNKIQSSFDKNSDSIAISFEGEEYSYKTIKKLVAYRISEIIRHSVRKQDVVCIESDNPLEYWISCFSCLFLGLVITPFKSNDGLPENFTDKRYIGIDSADIKVSSYREIAPLHLPDLIDFSYVINDDLSVIFFTSGTTGTKKSIGLTNKKIYSRIETTQNFFPKNLVSFTFMPPYSTLGFHFQLRQWVKGGLVILDKDFERIVDAFSKYSIDYIVGSPHQFSSFLDDISNSHTRTKFSVQGLGVGGGELTRILKEKLLQKFDSDIFCLFGASETGLWSINNVTNSNDYANLGNFTLGGECDVEIDDGESGYLKLRNTHMVSGYLNAPGVEFKDGWFYSGDRAIKKDNQIYLLGRDDSVVNVGGIKISPQEIDDFVCTLDGVKDAACFWIKDKYSYNEIWVAVATDESINLNSILRELNLKFGVSQGPKRVIPVQMIPRTYSGKPQRNLMSEKVTEQINVLKSSQNQNIRD